MKSKTFKSLEDLVQELDKSPEFRNEYRRQAPYYNLVSEIIRRRKELGITQRELSVKAGTYQSNLSRIEAGEVDVRLSTLIDLAEALGTRLQIWFVPFYDSENDQDYIQLFNVSSSGETTSQTYSESASPKSYELERV